MQVIQEFTTNSYDYDRFVNFVIKCFGENIGIKQKNPISYKDKIILSYTQICEHIKLESSKKLGVFSINTDSLGAKIALHNELKEFIKTHNIEFILACFYNTKEEQNFRLSLISTDYDFKVNKVIYNNFKRQSFVLGKEAKVKTAQTQLTNLIDAKTTQNLQDAFALEPITKEFYKEYERLFIEITDKLNIIGNVFTNYNGLDSKKAISAFVKKLLGRIVFLYFLQKKGWLGVPRDKEYGSGDKNFLYTIFEKSKKENKNFYENYLCKLFFETLNTKREDDYSNTFECKIPFLNGGLFEKNEIESDFRISQILNNVVFEEIFGFFNTYNFTIEESTPDDVEISIDPEMLGKIFENLIDYNKSSGAYYTRRGIVHFMCKNSLVQTLLNSFPNNYEEINNFVFLHQTDNDFIKNNAIEIQNIIKNLKILDNSVGSGAFPMGMLHEILALLQSLDKTMSDIKRAELKRSLIENSIYGVDIDADAIEIAKLRFWLSIAVEETSPRPLPNLDFKLMQGNSLLERICEIDVIANNSKINEQLNLLNERDSKSSLFSNAQSNKLQELFSNYYKANSPSLKSQIKDKILYIMDSAFKMRITYIDELILGERLSLKTKPKEKAKQMKKILNYETFKNELETLHKDYLNNNFHTNKIFLYKFFFAPVFSNNGFDIVIGNPPYIRQEDIQNKDMIKKEFGSFYNGKADIFTYFFKKGIDLLKPNGILNLITSNKWSRGGYGENLREYLLKNTQILNYIDLNGIKAFNATVDTSIITIKKLLEEYKTINYLNLAKSLEQSKFKAEDILDSSINFFNIYKNDIFALPKDSLDKETFVFLNAKELALKEKIKSIGTPLKDWDINIYRGIVTGYNEAFIIDTKKREEILECCDDSELSLKPYPLSEYDENLNIHNPPPSPLRKGGGRISCHSKGGQSEESHKDSATCHFEPALAGEESLRDSSPYLFESYYLDSKRCFAFPKQDKGILQQDKTCHSEPALAGEESHLKQSEESILTDSKINKIDFENNTILLTERQRTAQIIKPILRGQDIKRYSYKWAGLWIIGTFPALKLDIEDYPAVKNYLATFGKRLEQSGEKGCRSKNSNKWFETQASIAYYKDFAKPKIVWNPVSGEYFFSYIKEMMYFNNSLFMITKKENLDSTSFADREILDSLSPNPARGGAKGTNLSSINFQLSPSLAEGDKGGGSKSPSHRYLVPYMKEFSRTLRKSPTQSESKLWQELRNKKLDVSFRRQFVIDSKYIADFVCLEKRLIIECDGGQHNGNFKDIERDFYLESQNFRILRFWNNEIMENLEGVICKIKEVLEILNTHPLTPPQERGESLVTTPARDEGQGMRIPSTKGEGTNASDDFLLYILGCMNSTLYRWLITQITNLIDEGKYAYGAKDKLEKLPIPKISKKQELEFVDIVQQIIEAKRDVSGLSPQADNKLCHSEPSLEGEESSCLCHTEAIAEVSDSKRDVSLNAKADKANTSDLESRLQELEKLLDSKVFALYNLSKEEVEIINRGG
ncbi:Eco57I restriction-modification methylase domain-containing protein [Helicobacter sp. MIT 14-3879]|uniref:Eco57I restriction-modification methylase domain-containing protein n=1 Tax=Helicobacter sp. MIT 14-3879 TaxID=2040649 RepID=UPI000E1E9EBC|nr:DUF559 domain-containing protein [Helicobacter sp. MIT 14-3879]RDU62070.1 hypothetical protein CQA44_07490 [Helicobacter sp. MIT 14-3879]